MRISPLRARAHLLHAVSLALGLSLATGCDPSVAKPAGDKPAAAEAKGDKPEAKGDKPEAKAHAPTKGTAKSHATAGHMKEFFQHTTDLKQAIVRGNLDEIAAPAGALAKHPMVGATASWKPHMQSLQREATRAEGAREVATAARALASMGAACGACHLEHGASPRLSGSPTPEDEPPPAKQMQLHQWAADRMWEGLVRPSSDAWSRGCAELADVPLALDQDRGALKSKAAAELIEEIHALGGEACDAEGTDARAQVYAKFIASCSTCHSERADK